METKTIPAGAAKGAAVGAVEVVAAVLGWMVVEGTVRDTFKTNPLGAVVVGVIVLSLVAGAVFGAGLLTAIVLRIRRWWLVVPLANVACFLLFGVTDVPAVRAAVTLAVFTAAGAVAKALEDRE